MNFADLHELTHKWAEDRMIVKNGKVETQFLKLIEEFGELAAAVARQNKEGVKDAAGDMIVVMSNIYSIAGKYDIFERDMMYYWSKQELPLFVDVTECIEELTFQIGHALLHWRKFNQICQFNFGEIYNQLALAIYHWNMTPLECWEAAYEVIKDRKGYLNELGNFIKEEDYVN